MKNKISPQQIHNLGIEAAVAAAKNSKSNALIANPQNPNKYFIFSDKYKFDEPCEVIFKCSLAEKNPGRVQTNVSVTEYKNRHNSVGQFDNKVYILVHLDIVTGKNRFFCISHKDLVMLQYCQDLADRNTDYRAYTIDSWLSNGNGRNNMEIATLVKHGYEIWN